MAFFRIRRWFRSKVLVLVLVLVLAQEPVRERPEREQRVQEQRVQMLRQVRRPASRGQTNRCRMQEQVRQVRALRPAHPSPVTAWLWWCSL
jgi:hypothetical protein